MKSASRMAAGAVVAMVALALLLAPATAGARVLRVGAYQGIPGQFNSIQTAVDAAKPRDWVLVGPGDYHEHGNTPAPETAGVLIATAHLHLRGMNRNRVVVDGTKRDAPRCSNRRSDQRFHKGGWNGVEAFKASDVTIQNLTVCNYLTSKGGGEGNEIWWNGGDGSGKIGMGAYEGDHLTATSTFSNGFDNPRGEYGIFVSNSRGPGLIAHSYASNMGDAAYYVGACPNCHGVLRYDTARFSALGYSGTNSGGYMVISHSTFSRNKSGIVSNSQNNDDAPGPQSGLCPSQQGAPPGGRICTVYRYNVLRGNNNPNVPGAGSGLAGSSPVGSGIVLAGTEYIRVSHNRLVHNGSWGILVADLPDQETPPPISHCEGGIYVQPPPSPEPTCYYVAFGNQVLHNRFVKGNGFYGNPTNGDLGLVAMAHDPGNCVRGNSDPNGFTDDPPGTQQDPAYACGQPNSGEDAALTAQALCATQLLAPCPGAPGAEYPQPVKLRIHMPGRKRSMRYPCAGVPANPWCPRD
jgi:hypothetical protein